ncbi:MAG: efflux RND transporter permease subunit, partial [Planctomycetes bacterium]|nr:efflux RND transporter permease subunit [Planctomycetota bacterium]
IEKAWMKGNSGDFSAEHLGAVSMELIPAEQRTVTSAEVLKRWRELTPPIPDVIELSFDAALTHAGKPIEIDLKADDPAVLRAAADKLKAKLAEYPGVFDITDSMRPGKRELELTLTESGRALGLSEAELGKQARQAFYGEEAQRLQRGKHDVKVMVRYPLDERRTLANLAEMRVRTRDGVEIALGEVATISIGRGDSAIERSGRIRSVTVIADLDFTKSNANEIMASLNAAFFPELQREYPNLHYSFEGEQKNQAESMGGMMRGTMLAMFMIFAILALGFGSFLQPLIVMFAIPFGLAGAILAHWMLGLPITLLSVIGMLAMAGVAVNDSMVMISFINRYRQEGHSMFEAVIEAGPRRFRAIMLTSLTTFAGLGPIILEKSVQAQFIVPMAVSLAFGVMFATVITLFIVPAAYLVLYDGIKRGVSAVSAVLRRETRMQV